MDETHDPDLRCWVPGSDEPSTSLSVQNLPFVRFAEIASGGPARLGVAIGHCVLPLDHISSFSSLNQVMELSKADRRELRRQISHMLTDDRKRIDLPWLEQVTLLMPAEIGGYTDFYAGIHHARTVGSLFRPEQPLLPNYKWIPIGYDGRASSIMLSGTTVERPRGQILPRGASEPIYVPTRELDFELELGLLIAESTAPGKTMTPDVAQDHLFGVVLLNDWSARDLQRWEYQPLGPFLAKNFATSISPWVVTAEALEPFAIAQPPRPSSDPQPLPHLRSTAPVNYRIELSIELKPALREQFHSLTRVSSEVLYWTPAQLIAHHTSNGCSLRAGDLLGTGTISGDTPGREGCLLERTHPAHAAGPIKGWEGPYLADGDEVRFTGRCERSGFRSIGFGECTGIVGAASPAPD